MSDANELLYFDTLRRISKQYMTTEQLQRNAERKYGVSYHEALEMSYDNLQAEAADAIHGKRRPKLKLATGDSLTEASTEAAKP